MFNYAYISKDESEALKHYGVLGMKWGVRKRSRLQSAYDHQIRDAENLRKHGYHKEADAVLQVANKTKAKIDRKNKRRQEKIARRNRELEAKNKTILEYNKNYQKAGRAVNRGLNKSMASNERRRDKLQAYNRAQMNRMQIASDYSIAKNKAKMDKSYKNSAEYKRATTAGGKQITQNLIWGPSGSVRIDQYKEMGKSSRQAKAIVSAQQLLVRTALGAMAIGSLYVTSKR